MDILILNGPNLNLLGVREPDIYGKQSMNACLDHLTKTFPDIDLHYFQSNVEGEMINKLQEVGFSYDGVVLNAGAYTHTSIALCDCISAITTPVVEIHISNLGRRESFRQQSMITAACVGSIQGFGLDSYRLGVEALKAIILENQR